MGHSNRKIRTALYIGIGASILSVIALAMVVLYPYFLAKDMRSNGRDHVQKYATEYDLDHGEMRDVLDNWNIAKSSKNDGTVFLSIYRIMGLDKPVDYMHFEVYDSEADAEIEYLNLKKEYQTYNSNFLDCNGYFKSDEPYVDDGKVYTMVFLKDNIIIFTYLSVESCYAEMEPAPVAGADRSEEPISNQFDRASLENYIIKNQDAIKVYVLEILLKS